MSKLFLENIDIESKASRSLQTTFLLVDTGLLSFLKDDTSFYKDLKKLHVENFEIEVILENVCYNPILLPYRYNPIKKKYLRRHQDKDSLSHVKRQLADTNISIDEIEQIYTELDAAISALMERTGNKDEWENRFIKD